MSLPPSRLFPRCSRTLSDPLGLKPRQYRASLPQIKHQPALVRAPRPNAIADGGSYRLLKKWRLLQARKFGRPSRRFALKCPKCGWNGDHGSGHVRAVCLRTSSLRDFRTSADSSSAESSRWAAEKAFAILLSHPALKLDGIHSQGPSAVLRIARRPTITRPDFKMCTADGVTFIWSLFWKTLTAPPSHRAMQEFVVPRSIP